MKTKTQKATFDPAAKTSFTASHRKEGKCFFRSMQIVSLADKPDHGGKLDSRIEARIYGTGRVNTCCLWVHHDTLHASGSGSGQAGGYGYHRPSAAMHAAIRNAGFTLSRDIDGVGDDAMREALLAIAKALKIKRPALVEAYQ